MTLRQVRCYGHMLLRNRQEERGKESAETSRNRMLNACNWIRDVRLRASSNNPAQTWFSEQPGDWNPWPHAWCSQCQKAFQEEGAWKEKNEGRMRIKFLPSLLRTRASKCFEHKSRMIRDGLLTGPTAWPPLLSLPLFPDCVPWILDRLPLQCHKPRHRVTPLAAESPARAGGPRENSSRHPSRSIFVESFS